MEPLDVQHTTSMMGSFGVEGIFARGGEGGPREPIAEHQSKDNDKDNDDELEVAAFDVEEDDDDFEAEDDDGLLDEDDDDDF